MAKISPSKVNTDCASITKRLSDDRFGVIMEAANAVAAEDKRGVASNEDYIAALQGLIGASKAQIAKLSTPTESPKVVGPTVAAPEPTTIDAAKAQVDNNARAAELLKAAQQQWETTYEIDEDGTKWADLTLPEQLEYAQAVDRDDGTSGGVADRVQLAHLATPTVPEVKDTMVWATASGPVTSGLSVQQTQDIAQKVLDSLGMSGVVRVEVERNPTAAGLNVPAGVVPTGGTSNGKITLFADNMGDDLAAFKTVFHELFHLGLSQTLKSAQYIQTMLKFLADPTVRRLAAEWRQSADGVSRKSATPKNNWHALSVEEALAQMSEDLNVDGSGTGTKLGTGWVRSVVRIMADMAQAMKLDSVARALRRMTQTEAEKFIGETIAKARTGAPVHLRDLRFASTARPIQSGNKVIDAMPGAVAKAWEGLKYVASKAAVNMMLTDDLVEQAAKVVPAAATYMRAMSDINVAKTRQEQKVADILTQFHALPAHEKGTKGFSVNALIKASTTDQKWAFKPDWLKDNERTEIDPALKEWFDTKLSAKGREVVVAVFRHGHESLLEMQKAATESANSEFDALIKDANNRKDTAEANRLTRLKQKELTEFQTLFGKRSAWPYAPLRRFGAHVVMGMSARYVEARSNNDIKTMRELESDGDHYFVAFAETKQQADTMVDKIKDKFADGDFGTFEKLDQADSMLGGRDMLSALRRFRNMALEEGDQQTDARVKDLTRKLYLMLLAENSARKGELNRRNIAGADEDMMRSFATNGRATAHFIASLKTGGKVDDALQEMRGQVRKTLHGRAERQRYFNEIMRRHSMSLTYQPSPFVDSTLALTSGYMLLSNPSYFLINATQPWMMSLPMMAGKHTMGRAAPELLKAYRGMAAILKDGKLDGTDYALLPNDVREMVKKLADKGIISIELSHDMGTFRSSPDNRAKDALAKATGWVRGVAQSVETLNRLTTAVAALRLEKAKGASDEQAVEYAAKMITGTHGNYTGFNAPRFMRTDIGRVATQFRKFQLVQLTMFAKLAHQSLKGASKEERALARKVLGWNLSMLFAIGGMSALPGFMFISMVLGKIFGDDDEPDDLRAKITRDYGKPMADMLWGGLSQKLGAPVGGRIGAGGMLSLLPYTDIELSRDGYANVAVGLAGPTIGGVLPRMADGVGLMAKGDLWKGAEQMAPSGIANFSKSMRFAAQGVTQRNGDTVLTPDEIGYLDVALQAVGLPTNTLQDRTWLAGAKFEATKFYNDRTTELKRDYTEAVADNDVDGMREAREAWIATQTARRELGFKVQPLSELLKAPAERRKRELSTVGGVATTKDNAKFIAAPQ